MTILFSLKGTVKPDKGRGKQLGFPTANIPPEEHIHDGLYVGYATVDDHKLEALIFIGPAITFGETEKKAEIYILDFEGDLYHKTIDVDVLHKLRDNIKFESSEALIEQMKKDEEDARAFFQTI